MWILVAEALGALALFLFIVWWTLGPTQRRERDALKAMGEADRSTGRSVDEAAERARGPSSRR